MSKDLGLARLFLLLLALVAAGRWGQSLRGIP